MVLEKVEPEVSDAVETIQDILVCLGCIGSPIWYVSYFLLNDLVDSTGYVDHKIVEKNLGTIFQNHAKSKSVRINSNKKK